MPAEITASRLLIAAVLLLVTSSFLRLLYILPATKPTRHVKKTRTCPAHLLIVLGSGGHTAEMLSIIRGVDPTRYSPRTYVVSSGDSFGVGKATEFEVGLRTKYINHTMDDFRIFTVPRARKIHQSLCTTPLSSLKCLLACIALLSRSPPDLIMTDGPATGVIVILASLVVQFLGWQKGHAMRTIYIESWARVKSLSLSGKILFYGRLTDRFLVQWEGLKEIGAEWRGFLVG